MTRGDVFDAIAEILRDEALYDGPITPDLDLQGDAQLDSVDLLSLLVAIENRFEIILDDGGDAKGVRVDALVDQVLRQIENPAPADEPSFAVPRP